MKLLYKLRQSLTNVFFVCLGSGAFILFIIWLIPQEYRFSQNIYEIHILSRDFPVCPISVCIFICIFVCSSLLICLLLRPHGQCVRVIIYYKHENPGWVKGIVSRGHEALQVQLDLLWIVHTMLPFIKLSHTYLLKRKVSLRIMYLCG